MSTHDESKLPQWAQRRLNGLRQEVERFKVMEQAHALLVGREWFVIPGPPGDEYPHDVRKLWFLNADAPFPACSLFHGDVLLVGRSRHRWGGTPVPVADGAGRELRLA